MSRKIPTLILRAIIILSAIAGALVCVFVVPTFVLTVMEHYSKYSFWQYPIFAGLYAAALCFYFALFQFWLLLNGVDRDGSLSVKKLKAIRISAIIFSILYFVSAMPVIFLFADADDAPGVILVGAFLDTFPIGIAAVAAILERIIKPK